MVQQGGVSVNGDKVADIEFRLTKSDKACTVKMGKRKFVGILVE